MQNRDGYLRAIAAIALASCGTAPTLPETRPAQYAVSFVPELSAGGRDGCYRYIKHARLALDATEAGSFELSVGVIHDCVRGGGTFNNWEAMVPGQYRIVAGYMRFTPTDPDTPGFVGRHTNGTLRLVLPTRPDSLAYAPVTAELGTPTPLPTPRARVGLGQR